MALTKKQRIEVWSKSGGLCWYCGCQLPEKGWHADHVEPVVRSLTDGSYQYPERNKITNIVPACAPCNRMKSSLNIENFRSVVANFVYSLNNYSTQYKFAKKYGLVKESGINVVFWFEQNGKTKAA